MTKSKFKKGFSLVELLVVITIIAILSVVAYTAVGGQTVQARDSRRTQDISTIQSALELYFVEYSRYPGSLENGEATSAEGWKIPRKFLSSIPEDPKGVSYYYYPQTQGYVLGAVLENEGTPESYIVGNLDSGFENDGSGDAYTDDGTNCSIEPDVTDCFPYVLPE